MRLQLFKCQPSCHGANLLPSPAFFCKSSNFPILSGACWQKALNAIRLAELLDLDCFQLRGAQIKSFPTTQGCLLLSLRAPISWTPNDAIEATINFTVSRGSLQIIGYTVFCEQISFLCCSCPNSATLGFDLHMCPHTVPEMPFYGNQTAQEPYHLVQNHLLTLLRDLGYHFPHYNISGNSFGWHLC